MREINLVKKIYQSYEKLNLKNSKLTLALILMILTALLEMAGLSILYPLILIMTKFKEQPEPLLTFIPYTAHVQILFLLAFTAILFIIKNLTLYYSYRYNIRFAGYYYQNLIEGLYCVYIHKPLLEFKEESTGALTNIICVQTSRLIDGIIRPLLVIISEFFILIAITGMIFFISPEFFIATVVVCGGAAGIFFIFSRSKALNWGKTRMNAASLMHELVNNSSNGISEIKIFGKEEYLATKLQNAAKLEIKMFQKLEMYQQTPKFLIETLFVISILLFLAISFFQGTELSSAFAKFSVIAACSFRVLPSINRLVNSYSSFSFGVGPAIFLMDSISGINFKFANTINMEKDQIKSSDFKKTIHIKNLSYRYPLSDSQLLYNINLDIKKGERLGVIGSSGSGKSTFIKIIAGLYPPSAGSILLGDQNISDFPNDWKKNIAYVPQEPFILPGTIRENIAFGTDRLPSDSEILEVLEKFEVLDFINFYPNKLDSIIGEKGILLSGGQKQLICLARILFRKPAILLLDEPTASLDSKNEAIVLNTIIKLFSETTIIMVSHKRHNFTNFDSIYICEQGNLVKDFSQQSSVIM